MTNPVIENFIDVASIILDVYSGKVLAEYTDHDGASITTEPDSVMCRTEFEARKTKVFGSTSH